MDITGNIVLGKSLLDYYKTLDQSNIILLFKGAMSQNTLIRIGDLIRLPAEELGEDNSSKRLFAIMVEMAQNILYYSHEREFFPHSGANVGVGIVLVQQKPKMYEILCGNVVTSEQKARLEEQCLTINAMNQDQLREHYSLQRRKIVHESSKGAGLGLIDIARKSKNSLTHHFHELDNDLFFFSLSTHINR
jgi:hypothetical protein